MSRAATTPVAETLVIVWKASSASRAIVPTWAEVRECIARHESRGSYTARNPSGAGGRYQIMPEWEAKIATALDLPALASTNFADWPPADQELAGEWLWNQSPRNWHGTNCKGT